MSLVLNDTYNEWYRTQLKNCITSGEIISQGMTRNKALSELRTAKEMLELELITQQEYDSIKNICKDYIK